MNRVYESEIFRMFMRQQGYTLLGALITVLAAFTVWFLSKPPPIAAVEVTPTPQTVMVVATATPRPAATLTSTPAPVPPAEPTALPPDQPAQVSHFQVVAVEEREQLLLNALARMERLLAEAQADRAPPAPTNTAPAPEPAAARIPVAMQPLFVWEDGSCWTPPDMQVLHLCGASLGDGYVIRWLGLEGDSRGPEIADADWHAVRGTGDRLVWSGHHPGTHEAVTVTYWSGGHVLAVHVAGRLLFRIDRNHGVLE